MNKNDVPVLLIGLGGIGSTIVDKTYGKLKKTGELQFLEALVFDTDQASLSKLTNIPSECKIQTSTDKTVKYVLDRDTNAKEWFPEHKKILDMQLIKGAGQIRALSRLALRSAMKAGKLTNVQNVRDRIYKLGTNAHEKSIRIMIVTSLMGGTGSGMFLQIPLYLREIFQSKYSADRIEIQGTFLLPDTLKGSIDDKQKLNVYANAYASLKELHAIIMSLAGEGSTVDLEYRPDQIEEAHEKGQGIAVKDWPYDYCFIYDKEDSAGRVLDGIADYIDMAADNLFSQVYGPISDEMNSYFVNNIREIIRKNCQNIFGGLGIGELIYPYDDILEYINCRAIEENLKEQLLKIDEIYKQQMAQYLKSMDEGNEIEKPNQAKIYMDNFDSFCNSNDRFFQGINKQIEKTNEAGDVVDDLINNYLNKIDEKVENMVNDFINENKFTEGDRLERRNFAELKKIVDETEKKYEKFYQTIKSEIENRAKLNVYNDFAIYDDKKDSVLDECLKRDGKYINPVGIRYMLYTIRDELEEGEGGISELKENIESLEKKIESDQKKTVLKGKNVDESLKQLERVVDIPVVNNIPIFNNQKKFVSEYSTKRKAHYNDLRRYLEATYKYNYERETIKILNELIREYESMFDKLVDLKQGIEKTTDELLKKHNDSLGKNKIYILATEKFKEEIWENIPANSKFNTLSGALPEEMHKYLKINVKQKLKDSKNNIVGYDKIFNELIVDGCKKQLQADPSIKDLIDLNIVEAIAKEYDYAKKMGETSDVQNEEQYIKDTLGKIIDRIQPFAPPSTENSVDYVLWGINDNLRLSRESIKDKPLIETLITDVSNQLSASKTCKDSSYSKYEIKYLISRYQLLVSDFKKFYAGENGEDDGAYFTCYNKIIAHVDEKPGVGKNIEITPHIDKRWHRTLIDLNESVNTKNKKDTNKAFIIGLPMGYIGVQTKKISEEKTRIEFTKTLGITTPTVIVAKNENVSGNFSKLYDGLKLNPDLVEGIVQAIENHLKNVENDSEDKDIIKDEIIDKLINTKISAYNDITSVLDIIIKLYGECKNRKEDERNEIFSGIIEALYETIEQVVKATLGTEKDVVSENAKIILNKILENSNLAKTLNESSVEYFATVDTIKKKIKEYEEN